MSWISTPSLSAKVYHLSSAENPNEKWTTLDLCRCKIKLPLKQSPSLQPIIKNKNDNNSNKTKQKSGKLARRQTTLQRSDSLRTVRKGGSTQTQIWKSNSSWHLKVWHLFGRDPITTAMWWELSENMSFPRYWCFIHFYVNLESFFLESQKTVNVIFHLYCLKWRKNVYGSWRYFSFGTFQQNVFRVTSKHLLLFILILSLFHENACYV